MCINFAMYTIVKLKFVFFIFYRLKQVAAPGSLLVFCWSH